MVADFVAGKLDVREITAALSKFAPLAFKDELDQPPDTEDATRLGYERMQFEVVG